MSIANDNRLNELVKDKSFEVGTNPNCMYLVDGDGYFNLKADE